MSAFNDFIIAAGVHFGIPDDQLMQGSTVDATTGELEVVLRVALTSGDITAIGQRMARMALEAKVDAQVAKAKAAEEATVLDENTRASLRAEYNDLTAAQRSVYGSFHKFLQAYGADLLDPYTANDTKVDEEPAEAVFPATIWLDAGEATEQQRAMAIGYNVETGRYAVDPDDLTPEQKAKRGIK